MQSRLRSHRSFRTYWSRPQEVATLVALLASPRTANVTGANFVIDGGLVKTM
jgi:NAD(P)-dependent dehydrogenase (short-subunit alcohol dehydrogenase family)